VIALIIHKAVDRRGQSETIKHGAFVASGRIISSSLSLHHPDIAQMATSPLVDLAIRRATAVPAMIKAKRGLHGTSRSQASILFALQALSNSRETQHLNKISRLNRVEHSPSLKLIETSEVNPYASATATSQSAEKKDQINTYAPAPTPSQNVEKTSQLRAVETRPRQKTSSAPSGRALALGQSLLHSHAQSIRRSEAALSQARERLLRQSQTALERETAWSVERNRYRAELRSAGALIVVAIGIATAAVTWRLGVVKAGARASSTMATQPTTSTSDSVPVAAIPPSIDASVASLSEPRPIIRAVDVTSDAGRRPAVRTWKSLLWKHD
jgi:hypothetical protein